MLSKQNCPVSEMTINLASNVKLKTNNLYCMNAVVMFQIGSSLNVFGAMFRSFSYTALPGGLNKDLTVWLDGATSPLIINHQII